MRIRQTLMGVVAGGAMVIGLSACGGVDRDGTVEMLVDAGLSQAQAECVTDKAIDQIDAEVLTEEREATAEEEAILDAIFAECL